VEQRKSTARLLLPALGLCLVSLAVADLAAKDVPKGFPVGPWFLAPSFSSFYGVDDNPFLDSDNEETKTDRIEKLTGEFLASLPFRNSLLELEYSASKRSYDVNEFPSDLTQKGEFGLVLKFRSGDTLALRDVYRDDFARSRQIETGDDIAFEGVRVFEPEPYTINRWEVELARNNPRRKGYLVRLRRQDFVYKGKSDLDFFDYRGFVTVLEYRQPLSNHRRWVVRYAARRFDHYESRCTDRDPNTPGDQPCVVDVGVPFRKELSDSVELGLMGKLGDRQPFVARLGYTSFRYDGMSLSGFRGIVGHAAWRLVLGDHTDLELAATRRALPSNTLSYYINNAVRAKIERKWLRFEGSAELDYDYNNYAATILGCSGSERRDSTYEAELKWSWRVHERFKFKISAYHTNRRSTCENSEFQATGLGTGIALGW